MFSNFDILKILGEDLDWISPTNQPHDKKVLDLVNKRPAILCLTLGAKVAKVYDKTGLRFTCPTPQIIVADKVGAIDSFKAGPLVSFKWLNPLSR